MNPKILEMMRFRPSGHNHVSLDHIVCISEFLEEFCPIDKTKAKRMLRGSMGISMRYIQEYLDSFEAWKIIRIKAGNIEYLLSEPKSKIVVLDMKNEDVPDTFGIDNNDPDNSFNRQNLIDTVKVFIDKDNMLPCRYRVDAINGVFKPCNPEPGKTIIPNARECNDCKQREE